MKVFPEMFSHHADAFRRLKKFFNSFSFFSQACGVSRFFSGTDFVSESYLLNILLSEQRGDIFASRLAAAKMTKETQAKLLNNRLHTGAAVG